MADTMISLHAVMADSILTVDTLADLPAVGLIEGAVRYVKDTDTIYTYSGSSWAATSTPSLPSANVLIGNAGVPTATDTTVLGDIAASYTTGLTYKALSITNAAISASAAITRSKLASGTASHVIINDGSGVMSSEATLAKSRGGAGADMSSVTFPSSGVLASSASALTIGSVVFATTAGVLSQDNTNFYWDNTNKRLSIGQQENTITLSGASLGSVITIDNEGATDLAGTFLHRHSDSAAIGAHAMFGRSRGTHASPTVVQSGDNIGRAVFVAHDGTDYEQAARIDVEIDGTPGNNDMPGRIVFSVTPDGSNIPAEAMRISNDKTLKLSGNVDVISATSVSFGASIGANTLTLAGATSIVSIPGTLKWATANGMDVAAAGNTTIGASVGANNLTLGGASSTVVIPGNLEVQGTTSYIHTTNMQVSDKNIEINFAGTNGSASDAGLTIIKGWDASTNSTLLWDTTAKMFKAGQTGSEVQLVDLSATQTLTNKRLTSPKINEDVVMSSTATQLNYLSAATGTTGTTSTNLVFSTSPTLTTPSIATSVALNATAVAKFYDSDSSNFIGLKAGNTVSADVTFTLPTADGSAGQVLKTDGAAALGWVTAITDVTTTRGDLIRRGASALERVAVGTAGQILRSDGTDPNWFTPPTASVYLASSRTGLTSGSGYNIICDTEDFDAENYYDNATNYRYTPLVAGKYLVTLGVEIESTTADSLVDWGAYVLKNGTAYRAFGRTSIPSARPITRAGVTGSCIVDMNGSTDYLEVNGFGAVTGGGTYLIVGGNFTGSARYTWVSFTWIGK